jgi:integrase
MAVDDLWFSSKRLRGPDGKLLPPEPTKRNGRGKRYRVRWVDDTGQPQTKLFERKADADRHDANVRADVSRGQYIDPRAGRITVAQFAEKWLADQLHRASTVDLMQRAFRLHINPILGGMEVGRVRTSHLRGWVKNRSDALAPSTLRVVYSYLVALFGAASVDRVIGPSPCTKDVRLPDVESRPHFIPTPDQVHALAAELPDRYRAAAYLAAGCGLRGGEVFGLELADAAFLHREVMVERQLTVVAGRRPYLAPPKTKTSRRALEMADVVSESLAWHIEHFPPIEVEVDDETDPRNPVRRMARLLFTNAKGLPVHRASWSLVWAPAVRATGLPKGFGLHGLRHYYATLLIHNGASVKTVQLALGHSSPTVTLNTYTHEWPDAIDRTRSIVDAALGRPKVAAAAGARVR